MSNLHLVTLHLVHERNIGPENDNIHIPIIEDGMGTVAGDGDTLPLAHPVLDTIQGHNWLSLGLYKESDNTEAALTCRM